MGSLTRVLVIGGYGFFGRRLVQRLARDASFELLVGGRSLQAAEATVRALSASAAARLQPVPLDAAAPQLAAELRRLAPAIAVHTSGPFQGQDYRVPCACIEAGVHYVDLADARAYVAGIGTLDAAARAAGVLVASGASSVPALSSAAADALAHDLASVESIDIGISPGNRTERGLSTVQAILTYCGKPLPAPGRVLGWAGSWRRDYGAPVGRRLLSPCDMPDLVLLPARYAGLPRVRFGAGLELAFLHRGMNAMAWMAAQGLVRDWSRHAHRLKAMADWFRDWGSDAGAMHVTATGTDRAGRRVTRTWQLVARHGDGPFVPTLAATALVRKLAKGAPRTGATPCVGLLALQDVMDEAQGLAIDTHFSP